MMDRLRLSPERISSRAGGSLTTPPTNEEKA